MGGTQAGATAALRTPGECACLVGKNQKSLREVLLSAPMYTTCTHGRSAASRTILHALKGLFRHGHEPLRLCTEALVSPDFVPGIFPSRRGSGSIAQHPLCSGALG